MPESLAFAAPTPAFVYANVFFDAAVSVVNDHNTRITGVRKPLVLALRFHDTYDVVDEQDAILEPDRGTSLAVDPATGVCQLRVRLKTFTATCDGRTFCIEARAADSDAEPAFSTPITVVKEKLAIVQQPPDVWFKDEGGREKCMAITLVLEPAPGAVIEDRVIPLDVRLLYESGNAVLNQSILRLFPDMRPNMTRGRVTISFRIDDVSKNHQGQSFVLEVSPERQDSSSMFQDIAPTRTSVIAIRSKRNKRKLNAASHSVAAGSATRASPRSVAGTPRTNLMMMPQPHAHVGQSPMAQQPRPRKMATMAYGMMGAQQQLPPSGRSNEMQQMTWSSHVMATAGMGGMQQVATPMQSPAAATPQHHQQQQQQMVAEWKLAAFEIHPDGSVNTARPIYRCPQCRRMNDMDMMSANAAEHSPQCVFFAGGSAYRSQVEGAALQAQQQQQQQQQQQVQQYQQYQQSPMNSAPARSAPMMMSAQTAAMVDAQQNTVNISGISTSAGPGAFGLDVPANTSPKTLAALMQSSTQRPTISPYMNKVTAGTETPPGGSADAPSPATIASQLQPQEAGSAAGNLFASTAFRSQMEMEETATSAPLADKLTFLNKPGDEDGDPARDDLLYPGGGMPQESPSTAFVVGIGSALFNEMTSMGINLDQFDKVDAVGGAAALGDFTSMAGETTEEDQVYYILASMYTDAQSRKLGLPAFDQFQRMLGFYNEAQNDVGTQVVFHSLLDVGLSDKETVAITSNFMEELERGADAVHSLPKYQHNLILLREDALMYYWSQSLV